MVVRGSNWAVDMIRTAAASPAAVFYWEATMSDPIFFKQPEPVTLGQIAEWAGADIERGDPTLVIAGVGPVEEAVAGTLVFFDNTAYLEKLATTEAAAVLVARKHKDKVPESAAVLVCKEPYRSWALVLAKLYPEAMVPAVKGLAAVSDRAVVDPGAALEPGVIVEAGAVIAAGVEVGSGTVVRANAVIAEGVRIGRDCVIGMGLSVRRDLPDKTHYVGGAV